MLKLKPDRSRFLFLPIITGILITFLLASIYLFSLSTSSSSSNTFNFFIDVNQIIRPQQSHSYFFNSTDNLSAETVEPKLNPTDKQLSACELVKKGFGGEEGEEVKFERTSKDVEYFGVELLKDNCENGNEEKYFMYSPSGGFNNQRKELEYAIQIAKDLSRTLLVPMAAKHTSWWTKYHLLTDEDLLPMDLLLDFNVMRCFYPNIMPLDVSIPNLERILTKFNAEFKASSGCKNNQEMTNMFEVLYPKDRKYWHGTPQIQQKLYSNATVLFLKGPTMYHPWYEKEITENVRKHVVYSHAVKYFAGLFAQTISNSLEEKADKKYNCIHIRLGDYYSGGRKVNFHGFVKDMLINNFTKNSPLYIATEPNRPVNLFKIFETTFDKVLFSDDERFKEIWARIKNQDAFKGKENVLNDVLGLIEQMICVLAKKFKGTSWSNFSAEIDFMRKNKDVYTT